MIVPRWHWGKTSQAWITKFALLDFGFMDFEPGKYTREDNGQKHEVELVKRQGKERKRNCKEDCI